MWDVGNGEQEVALGGVQFRNAFIGLLDALGNLLHFSDERVGVFLFLLEARDFVASLVALCFQLLGRSDEFAALLVELTKSVQVERGIALLRHFGEHIEVIPKIVQVMHGGRRIP